MITNTLGFALGFIVGAIVVAICLYPYIKKR